MRVLDVFVAVALALTTGAIAEECTVDTVDECLRAVQEAVPSLQEEDCKSFMRVTVTPAISIISSTIVVTTTGTTTRTATQTITSSAEPSKRWLERHEVVDMLLGRAVSNKGPDTTKATSIPEYASLCTSSAAYESACSCLGITPATTTTVPTPSTTRVVRIVETATATAIHNVTRYVNSSSLHVNSTSAKFGNSTASTDKHRLKRPSVTEDASSTRIGVDTASITASTTSSSPATINDTTRLNKTASFSAVSNTTTTTSTGRFLNSNGTVTRPTAASVTGFHSGTAGTMNTLGNITAASASAPFLNSTRTAAANTTAGPTKLSNTTILAPLLNSTRIFPFTNGTNNSTNSTTTTIAPPHFLNATSSIRFANTTTTSPISSPTSTPTPFCSSSPTNNPPFNIRVSQPGSPFDGWYLQISGTGVLFNPSSGRASRFSFSSYSPSSPPTTTNSSSSPSPSSFSGHQQYLCSTSSSSSDTDATAGITTTADNATVVAIAEARPDVPGSAVYFVEPHVLEDMDNDRQGWYAPLECVTSESPGTNSTSATNGTSTLACAQGAKEYWVGCGLGLDITSDGDGTAVVDGWNCAGVALTIEYANS
ncbi:hypothetical protein F4813DRAFT_144637 [Daldinia decipiens]|uniref:uncharacterized protein n=1 Tax=Daldinia decipiens TaxID=326647 RepID=UPI0020C46C57|nr:uncharacterized protein F4813DRAFT_144637 [Daldinia decipiens]KAI1656077.1 hypothetical protein F4813DRAFT_144637 [Daldinia decipiens]